MKTVYAATTATKEVARDHYDKGEVENRRCTMHESINVQADSLAGLLDKLRDRYALALDDLFIPADEGEPAWSFDFDQYEDADGFEVGPDRMDEHKSGKLKVWHAIYSFTIERRTSEPIAPDEFRAAGIRTH